MAKGTHVTVPTRFVEANGIRHAYRRFGSGSGTPLVFLQHFRGGLDTWDPLLTDGLAHGRPVILFNNAGVASSSGETPNTIERWAITSLHSSMPWDYLRSMCSASPSEATLRRVSCFAIPIS
jgi:pimeloyl-ACP methyl ester carboxylesterase